MSPAVHHLSDAEIAGFMNWRGPGAYTAHAMRRVKEAIAEAVKRETAACAAHCDERAALERRNADSALARGDQPLWAGFANNADQNSMMAAELRRGDHHSDGRELKPPPAP